MSAAIEESAVQFGSTPIAYSIHRGRRQKTVAVRVDPLDGVSVRAPQDTSIEQLDEIVYRKAKWIIDRRRRHEDLPPPPSPREFVSGETFLYLGRRYRLKVERIGGKADRKVRLLSGRLCVSVGRGGGPGNIREHLVAWYRAHARDKLPERVAAWAPVLGLAPSDVFVRDQRKRWGSADSQGRVRLNWRIVQAPMRLVDYVVAHELVHLRHADHTSAFWATVGEAMADYEARREALRRVGRLYASGHPILSGERS